MSRKNSLTLEHIDPLRGKLVSGLKVPLNEVIADLSYNSKKTNRFVPYRVKDFPAPVSFGDFGEFLIGNEWVVCEFGGTKWWEESNRIGCSCTDGDREGKGKGGIKVGEENARLGRGFCNPQTQSKAGKIGGRVSSETKVGMFDPSYRESSSCKEALSQGGKKGGPIGGKIGGPKGAKSTNSQQWECLETGYVSTASGLSSYQKARGIDKSRRKRIK